MGLVFISQFWKMISIETVLILKEFTLLKYNNSLLSIIKYCELNT